ncbi:hypothetical protein Tco_0675037 [Tanacetum coccineum]
MLRPPSLPWLSPIANATPPYHRIITDPQPHRHLHHQPKPTTTTIRQPHTSPSLPHVTAVTPPPPRLLPPPDHPRGFEEEDEKCETVKWVIN